MVEGTDERRNLYLMKKITITYFILILVSSLELIGQSKTKKSIPEDFANNHGILLCLIPQEGIEVSVFNEKHIAKLKSQFKKYYHGEVKFITHNDLPTSLDISKYKYLLSLERFVTVQTDYTKSITDSGYNRRLLVFHWVMRDRSTSERYVQSRHSSFPISVIRPYLKKLEKKRLSK